MMTGDVDSQGPSAALLELQRRLESGDFQLGIIGLGYVGLPLAMSFADAGVRVLGIDVSERKVATLNAGKSDVEDVAGEKVADHVARERFRATRDFSEVGACDAISICVPTPLGKSRDPDISFIVSALNAILPHMRPGQLLVLESTTYPGTTREVLDTRLQEAGFRSGVDVALAFSPERIDPGNKTYGVRNTPKVVGGITLACTAAAQALYGHVCDRVVPVSSADAAETVKLLENTFRAVNIGLVNEIALVCQKLGINVWEVVDAAASKPFGFMPFYPGPGLGGHCIPIDPLYLSWKLRTLNYKVRFIELADDVNRSMPHLVVTRVAEALNDVGRAIRGSRILLVGMAYKGGVGDVRESPALDVADQLLQRGALLKFYDPHVSQVHLESTGAHLERATTIANGYDAAVILTHHRENDYQTLLDTVPLVIDTRNATKGFSGKSRIVLL